MLKITNLSVEYKGNLALDNISLNIPAATCTGIIGPNGAGKSTLMKSILEMVPAKTGNATIDNQPIKNFKRKIAYVAQRSEIDLSFPITVFDTVLTGTYPNLKLFQKPRKKEKEKTHQALHRLGLDAFKDRPLSDLSGGQLQRVFIARALAQEADYYFLDEPFVGIDMISEKIIIKILEELRQEGKAVLIVHHNLHNVKEYFDYLIILNKKLVCADYIPQCFTNKNLQSAYGEALGNVIIKESEV
ncbi:metal ABC transporter ATP-binding protein [Lactococcus ileimucosae]|uniref:Metal ABC transporter ATP-binding protein n=1 Tax=Lactococcus ileimucosae TaxID=2941329 RepID=A0ABV4D4X6_9LACT